MLAELHGDAVYVAELRGEYIFHGGVVGGAEFFFASSSSLLCFFAPSSSLLAKVRILPRGILARCPNGRGLTLPESSSTRHDVRSHHHHFRM